MRDSNPFQQMRNMQNEKNTQNACSLTSVNNLGWGGGIRTPECQDQNLVPYHLATPHYVCQLLKPWAACSVDNR
jgi:hypothetical protein